MSRLVVADGSELIVLDLDAPRSPLRVPHHRAGRLANRQPVWSPDGRHLAWSAYDRRRADAPTVVSIIDAHGKERVDHELVFPAFYLHWRPDGGAIAALSDGPLGIELTVLDVADGSQRIVARGAPLFFDWAHDGTLCVHAGQGSDNRIELIDTHGGTIGVCESPGRFTAPAWCGSHDVVVSLQLDGNRTIATVGRDGTVTRELATARGMARFAVSRDGRFVAYVDSTEVPLGHPTLAGRPDPRPRAGVPAATPDHLVVHDLAADVVMPVTDEPPVSLSWSPDGTKLLYCLRIERGEPPLLQWFVWSQDEGPRQLSMFRPSTAIMREYLPFADQYSRGRTWWAPDGSAFCFAGSDLEGHDGIWVQPLDRRAERVCAGQVAFWCPGVTER